MSGTIKKITIEGFKSIRKLDEFPMRPLNVLIGANGAGKSNFVSLFRLLRELVEQRLQVAVEKEGGSDTFLYLGPKETERVGAKFYFGKNAYEFSLVPTSDGRLIFDQELTEFFGSFRPDPTILQTGREEARLKELKDEPGKTGSPYGVCHYVFNAISSWVVYHFHDTSSTARVRRRQELNDNEALRPEADNLAAFLYRLKKTSPTAYSQIRDVIRLAAPFFDDFNLRPILTSPDMIQLEWTQRGSDYPFRANQLSDGTLRFICLATALLQPARPPTILFDEPELGLHPYALTLLGNLFKQAASTSGKQVIVSTQSALLLNEFEPEDVIIVERSKGESLFRRLDSADLSEWLADYTLGELWQKNVLGGRPREDRTPEPVNGGGGHR